jgi:hypothetical protein
MKSIAQKITQKNEYKCHIVVPREWGKSFKQRQKIRFLDAGLPVE